MNIDQAIITTILFSYTIWFLLAVLNNIVDFETNLFLIKKMMSMKEIIDDNNIGKKIQKRAIANPKYPPIVLKTVIFYQLLVGIKLIECCTLVIAVYFSGGSIDKNILIDINIAFLMLLTLWFGFLIGGLWFGYWLKMPQVQAVHMTLILITLVCILIIN